MENFNLQSQVTFITFWTQYGELEGVLRHCDRCVRWAKLFGVMNFIHRKSILRDLEVVYAVEASFLTRLSSNSLPRKAASPEWAMAISIFS